LRTRWSTPICGSPADTGCGLRSGGRHRFPPMGPSQDGCTPAQSVPALA
jgi:hypothetical protein